MRTILHHERELARRLAKAVSDLPLCTSSSAEGRDCAICVGYVRSVTAATVAKFFDELGAS